MPYWTGTDPEARLPPLSAVLPSIRNSGNRSTLQLNPDERYTTIASETLPTINIIKETSEQQSYPPLVHALGAPPKLHRIASDCDYPKGWKASLYISRERRSPAIAPLANRRSSWGLRNPDVHCTLADMATNLQTAAHCIWVFKWVQLEGRNRKRK